MKGKNKSTHNIFKTYNFYTLSNIFLVICAWTWIGCVGCCLVGYSAPGGEGDTDEDEEEVGHRQVEDQDHDVCAGGLGRRVRDLSPDLVDQGQAGAERHPRRHDQHEHHLEAEVDHGLGGERGGP